MAITFFLLACTLVLGGAALPDKCPPKCMCSKTTVRCMFLPIERVPHIPRDTTILDLRFNKLKEIPPNTFKELKNLQTLLLNNNHITKLQNGAFTGLYELRYLYLYKNRIREIEGKVFQDLPKLEQLYLHHNDLIELKKFTFSNLPALQRLYMHYNKLESLHPHLFARLTRLERLFLHNNKIARIPSGALENLKHLSRLRLDSNALVCDCNMLWLVKLLKTTGRSTQTSATCAQPVEMEGKDLAAMSDADFHCRQPKIMEEPHDVEVNFGGTAFFTCKVDGDPEPDIVWLQNKKELSLSDPRYTVLKDGTLMIEKSTEADMGVYECVAKNPMGETKSRVARMEPHKQGFGKPRFLRTPLDWISDVGDSVRFICQVAGVPPPVIAWTHNDKVLTTTPKHQIDADGSLLITDALPQDAGRYRCSATNFLGTISAVALLRVNDTGVPADEVLPSFTTHPENLTLKTGSVADLLCAAEGYPRPTTSWYKSGKLLATAGRTHVLGDRLRIEDAKESDSGLYICRAANTAGESETTAHVTIREERGRLPPRLLHGPYDMTAPIGTTVELPCRADGEPRPVIIWRKDGQVATEVENHRRISPAGSLYLHNLTSADSGLYECSAVNDYGKVAAQGVLQVKGDVLAVRTTDSLIHQAAVEAARDIDQAVNNTLQNLHRQPLSGNELMTLVRFPNAAARQVARAAEVYERTLFLIRRHVEMGMKVSLSDDFRYKDILTTSQLALVANLSGCMVHRTKVNCTDMCYNSKYRSIDGSCNNLRNPVWGASLTPFVRMLSPIYEDGFSMPVGWTKGVKYFGYPKPSARLVSTSVISTVDVTADDHVTHMVMQWGQFLDHDMDHAIPAVSSESWGGINCKKSCDLAAPCYPIEVPPNDPRVKNRRCIDVVRSSAICGSGQTSVLWGSVQPREQINQLTSFIDASQVYGFSRELSNVLRNFSSDHGRLREGMASPAGKPLLPFAETHPYADCRRDPAESDIECFLAGDVRSNEQVALLAMHTIWFREHNRVAGELRKLNPTWDGDLIFNEARKVVGAEMQHITYTHWLPLILGSDGMEMLGEYRSYNPNLNPGILNAFATAAFRFGHSLINPVLERLNSSYQPIPEGSLPLHKAFFSPWRLVVEGGVDPLMRGMFVTPAKLKTPDQTLNSELTEHLFQVAHAVALDLAAINIQRGRDHALPGYNSYRELCNLTVADTFDDLRNEISSPNVRNKLKELYGHPGNIDLWVGGILEDQLPGAKLGPTFRCILVEQFRRLRDGDRFWYENPSMFKPDQLVQIKQASLARIICDNGDNITEATRNLFVLPAAQGGFTQCSELPAVDLQFWTECCHECTGTSIYDERARQTNSISRAKRATNFTISEGGESDPVHNEIEDEAKDERIEGIENVLEEFQRTLKQLRRKLRKLEHHCNAKRNGTRAHHHHQQCNDRVGEQTRLNGETWARDACTQCTCQEKQITCTKMQCSPTSCKSTVLKPGQCCPECLSP